uniref:Uncharacterized protein n=1 Tax=Oryza barthii TaxID=65489 RepID=A0A0D3GHD1_9ORYZ
MVRIQVRLPSTHYCHLTVHRCLADPSTTVAICFFELFAGLCHGLKILVTSSGLCLKDMSNAPSAKKYK